VSLDREIAHYERLAQAEATPEVLIRLGELHLRADDEPAALRAYRHALELTGVVPDYGGGVDLHPLRPMILKTIEELEQRINAAAGRAAGLERRAALLLRLDQLTREEHDELIRLEVALEVEVHPEEPRCPACQGPMAEGAEAGTVICARSGADGDLCRHTDARRLYACDGCGLVVRAWVERKIRNLDPFEPPLLKPERNRCPHCNGRVADWRRHVRNCPRARPAEFPICDVCRKRGYHRSPLRCPRCKTLVGETPCAQKRGR